MSSKEQEHSTPSFSEIRQRLQSGEDFDLAHRLQEREYEMYYNHNRNVNGTIVSDRKKTREEQLMEDEHSIALRRMGQMERCMTDEEYARQLQEEMDRMDATEQMDKEDQLREDERLARRLQENSFNEVQTTSQNLISFHDQVPIQTQYVPEVQYEEQTTPSQANLIHLSPTNPFLHDVEEYFSQQQHRNSNY
uniref:CCDC50_N domain-containing protein n=1 Tax=Caenorhabditis tropicalis TaxID=1561998 RepID=A0A1I7T043_9PELO